jgi:hypothetical protein
MEKIHLTLCDLKKWNLFREEKVNNIELQVLIC